MKEITKAKAKRFGWGLLAGSSIAAIIAGVAATILFPAVMIPAFASVGAVAATVMTLCGVTVGSVGGISGLAMIGGIFSALFALFGAGTGIEKAKCMSEDIKDLENKETRDNMQDERVMEEKQKNEPNLSVSKAIKIAQQTVKGQVNNNKSNENEKTRNDGHNHSEQGK